jgi:DNA-binding GntR family transcriptional regulator
LFYVLRKSAKKWKNGRVAKYIEIAERFRARLRTEEFPAGSLVSAVRTMQDDYGVTAATAYRALKHLESLGELRTTQGAETEVLPEPPPLAAEPRQLLAEAQLHLTRASALLTELAKRLP